MRKGFWDRRVANIASCWKELKYIAKSCFDVRENDFGERSMVFFAAVFAEINLAMIK